MSRLADLLESNRVLMHPFVVGEIACGNLSARQDTLQLLSNLPGAPVVSNGEVTTFIESNRLMSKGIGFADAHLLAAVAPMRRAAGHATRHSRARGNPVNPAIRRIRIQGHARAAHAGLARE